MGPVVLSRAHAMAVAYIHTHATQCAHTGRAPPIPSTVRHARRSKRLEDIQSNQAEKEMKGAVLKYGPILTAAEAHPARHALARRACKNESLAQGTFTLLPSP